MVLVELGDRCLRDGRELYSSSAWDLYCPIEREKGSVISAT